MQIPHSLRSFVMTSNRGWACCQKGGRGPHLPELKPRPQNAALRYMQTELMLLFTPQASKVCATMPSLPTVVTRNFECCIG